MKRMRKIILTIFFGCFICLISVAQPKAGFNRMIYEFGVILWKNPVKASFQIKNEGNEPLVLFKVTASCACTVVEWTRTPIAPGEVGEVIATFDAKALGYFQKSVGVYCNASEKPIYLTLRGQVSADPKNYNLTHPYAIGAIRLNRDAIEFDDVHKGDKPVLELLVANTSNESYVPVLMHLPPYLETVAVPEKIGKKGTGKIKVALDTDKLPKFGLTTATVYLSRFMGDKVGDENAIPVSVVLLPDFENRSQLQRLNPPAIELSSQELTLEPLAEHEKKSQTIIVKNVGKSDLEITDLQVFNPTLGVQLKKRVLKPGMSTKMKITAYGKYLKRVKGKPRVLMITNDPNCPKIIVNVNVNAK